MKPRIFFTVCPPGPPTSGPGTLRKQRACRGAGRRKPHKALDLRQGVAPPPSAECDSARTLYSSPMQSGLYLGKAFDPKDASLGAPVQLDSSDLLTHGLIVGMTGSGKTGLAIALIEEVLRQGVPVHRHRPQGRPRQPAAALRGPGRPRPSSPGSTPRPRGARARTPKRPRPRRRGHLEEGPRRVGPRPRPTSRRCARAHEAVDLHARARARASPLNVLQSLDAPGVPVRVRGGGPARRDRRRSWPACSGLLEHRRRPAAVARVHPPRRTSSSTPGARAGASASRR